MIYVVKSLFNTDVTNGLYDGFLNAINESNYDQDIKLIDVPGAFDIPGAVRRILDNDNCKIIVTLGCVIKGETAHFEYISESVTKQIMELSLNKNNIPVLYGILTTYNYQQALDRIKNDNSNKGYEVMSAAIMMVNQFLNFKK